MTEKNVKLRVPRVRAVREGFQRLNVTNVTRHSYFASLHYFNYMLFHIDCKGT